MRIGIFGGTFDPPHLGHLILAEEALYQLALDRILWVLTEIPPHKLGWRITELEDRVRLTEAAIGCHPFFSLSRIEIDRPGPHFAVDTVRMLKEEYPHDGLFYIMGEDSLRDLPTWRSPDDFVHEVDGIGVMRRTGVTLDSAGLEESLKGIFSKVLFFDTPLIEISASAIRERVRAGKPFRYFLLPQVYDLILENDLYLPVK
ncbi:MAG: nicotinate (nicotinamide) nucleotide adenylyltransferase [Anaerolineaceae bacterium]|nr:nicotinate (nicotinamide) nucleotide adenylyltransferase [Anaerolineaceae bacterium]